MDTPEQESTAPDQGSSTLQDRLAGLLQSDLPDDYQAPEPDSQPDAEVEAEGQEAEPVEAPQETEAAPVEDTAPEVIEVEADDGRKFQVPKELEGHFLRDRDYRQKTMALADERKSLEAVKQATQVAYQAATELGNIVTGIKTAEAGLLQLQNTDWQALEQSDPIEFLTRRQRFQELAIQRQALIHQFDGAREQMVHAQRVEYAATIQKNEPLIRQKVKDWGPERQKAIAGLLQSEGFSSDELNGSFVLADARAVRIIDAAARWFALEASRPATQNKVTTAPPVARPGNKVNPALQQQADYNKALARVRKSGGETEDLVAALKARRR